MQYFYLYRRVTDGQTDGNAIASTALAMRAWRQCEHGGNASIAARCKNPR